ncbi:hypothetical protein AYO40_05285 [Planctomycetaceae bacterium SCGC AG-212-D15]|nr:hypothetical protein AYO40_05285 [Planctomycetaceae bacterium SCGC AG-212-D15]
MAAKIAFPNRACPKCGKPIHVRVKAHECGWKADGATKSSLKARPAKHAAANGSISKMEAVRRVLSESGNDTMPIDIQSQLKKDFNIKMDPSVISNYKSTIIRLGGRKKKLGRPKGRKLGRPAGTRSSIKASPSSSITIADIQAVKALAERLGADKLRQLADVLA